MRRLLTTISVVAAFGAWPHVARATPPDTAPPEAVPVDTTPGDTTPVDTTQVGSTPAGPSGPIATVAPASGSAPGDLVIVPAGCASAPPAAAVFAGTLQARGAESARFHVEQVRAGSLDGFALGDLVDVGYGSDVRYLDDGESYLVGVAADAQSGRLTSKVREPQPLFGGDAVIGINDSDVSCPAIEDPVRTLHADGTALDVGVLTPLHGSKRRLLRAILRPLLLAFAALAVLAAIKLLGQAAFRSAMVADETIAARRRHRPQ